MFVRKLYYDLTTGAVLESHMRQGDVRMTTFAEDCAALPSLAGRTEADTGCMLWTEPDGTVEAAFAACAGVTVDVTRQPHAVVFDYSQPEDTGEISDSEALSIILGGKTA